MQFFQNVTLWLETFKYARCDEYFFSVQNFVKMKNEYSTVYSMFFLRKSSLDFKILKFLMWYFPIGFGFIAIF
jgi:hypothetical protein